MVRWALLFLIVLAVAGGAALLLLDDGSADPDSVVASGARPQIPDTQVDALATPASRPLAPEEELRAPLSVDDRVARSPRPVTEKDAGGPSRTVTGRLLRASDGSPLGLCRVRSATPRERVAAGVVDEAIERMGNANLATLSNHLNDLMELDSSASWSTTADERGVFSLTRVPTREASLIVFGPSGPPIFFALDDGEVDLIDLELVLDTGFIVEGTVLDAHRTPIEGALVTAATNPSLPPDSTGDKGGFAGRGGATASTTTDSGGFFRLLDVIRHPRSASVLLVARATDFVDGELDVPAPLSPSVTGPVEFRLSRSGSIAGTVTLTVPMPDNAAEGVQTRATVAVVMEMTSSHGRHLGDRISADTDADGGYRIDGVPPGRFVLRAYSALLNTHFWQADIVVAAGSTTTVDWILGAGAMLSGKVVDAAGRALTQVSLRLEHVLEWDAPDATGSMISSSGIGETRTFRVPGGWRVRSTLDRQFGFSVNNGRYLFAAISPGLVHIAVMDAPAGLLAPDPREVSVTNSQHVRDVDFVMARGVVLKGRVQDDMGRLLRNARAQVSTTTNIVSWDVDQGVRTDDQGRFEIGGLTPGQELTLWVTSPGFADHWQKLTPGEGLVEVQLKPAVLLSGVALLSESGLPLRRYRIVITQAGITRSREISNLDGRFALQLDDDVPVSVSISASGRVTTTLTGIRPSDTLQAPLEVRLPPGG
jgi:hypothetical protein